MNNFLLELMVEEIPSRFQSTAVIEFEKLMITELEKFRIPCANAVSYISPRRIVFSAKLDSQIPGFIEEKRGPQATASPDAIEKFLQAHNISRSDCIEKLLDKKMFLFAIIKHNAQATFDLLAVAIKNAITGIRWQKSMRWGNFHFNFVRPLRNIVSIFDNKLLNIDFNEISLKSCSYTFGHRFLSPQKIYPNDFKDYMEKTKQSFVIVDQNARKQIIIDEFKKLELKHNISIEITDTLLDEVVGLVEYPVVLLGKIPYKFMKLPEEAIITPMRTHQRYFPARINGKLAPYFVFIANNIAKDGGKKIIAGNERVLNARLADALFFFETDLKNPLESYLENLKKIVFNETLGSVFDRSKRVADVCGYICEDLAKTSAISENTNILLKRIAYLAKCDLATFMVCEFTELQGIIGSHYAKIQGENDEVCRAIREQYNSAEGITSIISALYSLADKIEIITSFFAIGKEPTGSKDPFALRRAAIGVLKIIKNYNFAINLENIAKKAFERINIKHPKYDTVEKVIEFIKDRLKVILKESGISHNVVAAVSACKDDILSIYQKAYVLNDFLHSASGENLLTVYKRAKNIAQQNNSTHIDESLFIEKEENELLKSIRELESQIIKIELSHCNPSIKFQKQLTECLKIEKTVSAFFDKVLVNTDEKKIKENRLNLLNNLVSIFDKLCLQSLVI